MFKVILFSAAGFIVGTNWDKPREEWRVFGFQV